MMIITWNWVIFMINYQHIKLCFNFHESYPFAAMTKPINLHRTVLTKANFGTKQLVVS